MAFVQVEASGYDCLPVMFWAQLKLGRELSRASVQRITAGDSAVLTLRRMTESAESTLAWPGI